MNEIHSDSYFENIQLFKLVSSAEVLLQQLYKLVSYEDQRIIDQWLCFKQEFDHCSNSAKFSLNVETNENVIRDDIVHQDDQKSYSSDEYSEGTLEEISSDREDVSCDETCDENLFSSGFESESHNDLDTYLGNFRMFTDSLVSSWFNNLKLDGNSCGDHISNGCINFNPVAQRPFVNQSNVPVNMLNNVFLPYNDVSDFRFCHCCANGVGNCHLILSLPVGDQIAYLREIKTPLIQSCYQITSHTKRCDLESKTSQDLVMLQEVLELIDMMIEMKNNDYMADFELEKLKENNPMVYTSVFDCFKMLSSHEMHYLFVCFLNKMTTLRENSSNLDKLILQLDNTIVDKEIRLRYLNKSYIKLRDVCASLKNKSKHIQEEPVTDNLDAIINANDNPSSTSDSIKDKGAVVECSSLPSSSTIPNRCIKALHPSSLPKNFGITRKGKKLIIREDTNS